MVLGTVTQKFGKISWFGATEYAMSGVSNCMPSAAGGAARSVAPTGPAVMPGAVGMPVAPLEPPLAVVVVDPLDEPDEPPLEPLLLPVAVEPPEPPPEAVPPLSPPLLVLAGEASPVAAPLSVGEPPGPVGAALHATRNRASARAGRTTKPFNLSFDVRSMTPPRLTGLRLGAPPTTHPQPDAYPQEPGSPTSQRAN